MQLGLQQLVTQVSEATTAMVENIGSLAQGNQKLYQQSTRQAKELEEVTAHIADLETHVEGTQVMQNSPARARMRPDRLP